MLNLPPLEHPSPVENSQFIPPNSNAPLSEGENIIIIREEPKLAEETEANFRNLQEFMKHLHQLARFPKSVDYRQVEPLASQLNEAVQKEPCLTLEQHQVRILQLKQMLSEAKRLPNGERLCLVLKQHLLHTERAAGKLFRDSATPVQDSLWPLYERILRIPGLQPDFFGAAVATLQEKLPYADSFDPLIEKLQALLPELLPPAHYFWKKTEPFTDALLKLKDIKLRSLALLHQLKNAPDGYTKHFCAPVESIFEAYQSFFNEFKEASEKRRKELCIPKAQLSGVGLGCFSLCQKQARDLVCRNLQGEVVKENKAGTHAVHNKEGVFYKPNDRLYHIAPEMEFAIYAFYHLLGDQGTAPTALAKINHVFFEGAQVPFGRTLQAGYGITGISLQELIGMTEVLPFLERCLGLETSLHVFEQLLEEDWEQGYIESNPNLLLWLSYLTFEESADYLIQMFEALFEPLDPDKRCIEFVEIPVSKKTKRDFYEYLSAHSAQPLVCALALLERYPDLTRTCSKEGVRQTSFTELANLCRYIKKINLLFPNLSAEQLLQELPHLMNRFDSTNFSTHFVVTLLTNPCDHHSDNLMVTMERNEQGGVLSLSLVGIDNDRAFFPLEDDVRSMLYLLEPMKARFSSTMAQRILDTTAEGLILDWLVALEEQNHHYQRWQKQRMITQEDLFEDGKPSLNIPLKINSQLIPAIYAKAHKLVGLLKTDPSLTHRELLRALQPRLAQAYERALASHDTLEWAYTRAPRSFIYSTIPHQFEEDVKSFKQLPAEAALSFLKTIDLGSFPPKLQVSLIGKALHTFPTFGHSLNIPGDPAKPSSRRELFLTAVEQGHHALVARLLEEEKKSRLGVEENSLSLLEERNPEERTALLLACLRLDVEMIRLLIDYGANPQVCDIVGQTALTLCLTLFRDSPGRAAAAARFLGDHAAILFNAASKHRGWSALHHLINIAQTNPEETEPLLAYLIEKGATPDLIDNQGKTPLDYAIELNQERFVIQLIRLGAGQTLNIPTARAFFDARPHLQETFTLLKSHSLLLRWHLALDMLRDTDCPGTQVFLETATLKIELPRRITQELLDAHGDILPQAKYGRRNVHRLDLSDEHELYIKQYPQMPGVEYAVGKLFELLIGHGTSFTDLAKVTLPDGNGYPVLISQGIRGENFYSVLSDPAKAKHLEKIDSLAYSELLLASLLVNFEDAQPSNFILEPQPGGSYRLVTIDNDHAFVAPLVNVGGTIVQIKCILYCLDLMRRPIHPAARERFLSFIPENFLHLWLNQLKEQDQRYDNLFKLFDTKKSLGVVIPILFRTGAIAEIYQQFQRLQFALKESPELTGLELLRLVMPSLGILYEEVFHTYKDPLERFESLTKISYFTAISRRLETLLDNRQMLKLMDIPPKNIEKQGPDQALQELNKLREEMQLSTREKQKIRHALQLGNVDPFNHLQLDTVRETVINGVHGVFEGLDFKAMQAGGKPDLKRQNKVLDTILKGNYRFLRLSGCAVLDGAAISKLLNHSPHLLSLELNDCPAITEKIIAQLVQARYLNRLRLSQLPQLGELPHNQPSWLRYLRDHTLSINPFNQIGQLDFIRDQYFVNQVMNQLGQFTVTIDLLGIINLIHPTLRRLEIVSCHGVQQLVISHTLKSLVIDGCWNLSAIQVKAPWLRGLPLAREAPQNYVLQTLHLKACPKLEPWWTLFKDWLANTTHEIRLQGVPPYPNKENPGHVSSLISAVFQRPEAQQMLASLQNAFQEGSLKQIISLLARYQFGPLLEKLELGHDGDIVTDALLQILVKKCPNLTNLGLGFCNRITNAGLQAVAHACPNLTIVKLHSCDKISLTGLQALAEGCPNLTKIFLWHCEQITDAELLILGQGCPKLECISLNACKLITDAGLQALAQGCSKLTSIDLLACEQITDAGLQALANGCPNLKSIVLMHCQRITAAGLQALAQGCPYLTSVNLDFCSQLAEDVIRGLQGRYPKMGFQKWH